MDAIPDWSTARDDAAADAAATALSARRTEAIAASFLWHRFSTVCAPAGGSGLVLSAILFRHTHVWGAVIDATRLADAARQRFHAMGLGLRASFVAGNPVDRVPAGFDAYLLELGDESAQALALLPALRRAIAPRGRLVLALGGGDDCPVPGASGCVAGTTLPDLARAGFAVERGFPVATGSCLLLARPA
ncbi:methyltransferase [Zavarzinia sp. CC-PAN008]|uniref:methyltransferase n=1 Tax=Zavarzinia sp. CC-PAN008 TaxID=3243332 RepID=UPI003F743221